jgi:hypothetical protein
VKDVRSVVDLWPHRQRRHVVVACTAEVSLLEAARPALAELRAELLVERDGGPLSAALGRPSVTVASRFGRVGWRGDAARLDEIFAALEGFELACPECGPQAWGDPGGFDAADLPVADKQPSSHEPPTQG